MESISVRGVDEKLAPLVKEAASIKHKSVNQFVLETFKRRVGVSLKRKRFTRQWLTWTIFLTNGPKMNFRICKRKN